ncbi:uncharacterized protein PSANT_03575 [Moesziomyces antarcticus]|uniref:Uncharacterized protein n=1 Tax=Pseudozyma antarctica TaxID=84753 RepID=A0A5C3FRB0_PSEA2|nr:uncharacterized protein PSANT_03575 [Moesziomyces antarcticus]
MQIYELFPVFALLGMAYAVSPPNADIAICYHGKNSAYSDEGTTIKDPDVFGGLRWADCDGVGLDCFWMSGGGKLGDNIFEFMGDGGSDNLAYVMRNNNHCEYNRDEKHIYCHT